ncbi:SDR family NAD(P)-dependent oxidoreductase [Nonomuraea sp. NPDC050643]|uniref:SDR family NAD(P)-dependent oxidoreductase n=1 Tax=Nonomuraea sp. NPDC050643 TaxID=3155660 RepID=UPI0033ED4064
MMYPDLRGKVALVTGGSGGIGRETARLLAAQGMRVVINGRDPVAIEAAVSDVLGDQAIGAATGVGVAVNDGTGGRGSGVDDLPQGDVPHGDLPQSEVIGVVADSTDFAAVEAMRVETERRFGPVDVLAIFAGGGTGRPRPIDQMSDEDWHATLDANLTSTYLVIKSFLPGMRERRSGSIVTMASLAARTPTPASVAYTAAKAGVIALTKQLAYELGPAGIRVNAVSPSTIMTDRLEERMPREFKERMLAEHPLGRLGTPLDVAGVTAFLASDVSSWLTGLTIDVAGGKWMP